MSATRTVHPQAVSTEVPPVPLTIEGYSVLHQMMRFRWTAWRDLPAAQKAEMVQEASRLTHRDGAELRGTVGAFFAARTQRRSDVGPLPAVV